MAKYQRDKLQKNLVFAYRMNKFFNFMLTGSFLASAASLGIALANDNGWGFLLGHTIFNFWIALYANLEGNKVKHAKYSIPEAIVKYALMPRELIERSWAYNRMISQLMERDSVFDGIMHEDRTLRKAMLCALNIYDVIEVHDKALKMLNERRG